MRKLFFDTETTGFFQPRLPLDHSDQPNLVQIAWILDEDGYVINEQGFVIHPYGFTIPDAAANVHGITTQIAIERGVELSHAMDLFEQDAASCNGFVAHNAEFDLNILRVLAAKQKMDRLQELVKSRDAYCTMKTATNICKIPSPRSSRSYKWPTLMEAYQLLVDSAGFVGAHDALVDVKACREVYYALQAR